MPPSNPDSDKTYVFYLHGQIVEGSDGRPVSREHGPYEFQMIVEALRDSGFVVISEVRSRDTDVETYARSVATWIEGLVASGVPPGQIAVIGGSKGGIIALRVSASLPLEEVRYVILPGVFRGGTDSGLHGRVLSIHDESDRFPMDPAGYLSRSPELSEGNFIVTRTGMGHGLIFQPHREWMDFAVDWIRNGSID